MSHGWQFFTGADLPADLPAEQRERLEAEQKREPIAEVTIKLYGLDRGQSGLEVRVSPEGELRTVKGTGPDRAAAYDKLLKTAQRELADGLTILRNL